MRRVLKRVHKWVGLLIGAQVFLWVLSGLVISLLDAEKVSGQRWARAKNPETQALGAGALLELQALPAA